MRLFILLLLGLGLGFSACKKYNLKQPCHLSFNWRVLNNNPGDSTSTISSIYFTASSIEINGTRKEGEDINLLQSIPAERITVAENTFSSVKVDIPMGNYTSLEAGIKFSTVEGEDFGVRGQAYVMGTPVLVKVTFKKMDQIVFKANQELDFKKKKDYSLNMCLDYRKLMIGITQADWDNASVSQDPDGPAIVIEDVKNHSLYSKIAANLPNAVYIVPN